ncbi:hypothetical protein BV898_19424 [Hypsibius exemplaris]|uniref:Uncharacterized protein n=1 Tax=Hypsibius exemplaris TaxID=2072580 RepID=A0A9X6RNX7_HYPEX|nr:hypothetical protein BV898_19424 [Hypsibius exemplaris]
MDELLNELQAEQKQKKFLWWSGPSWTKSVRSIVGFYKGLDGKADIWVAKDLLENAQTKDNDVHSYASLLMWGAWLCQPRTLSLLRTSKCRALHLSNYLARRIWRPCTVNELKDKKSGRKWNAEMKYPNDLTKTWRRTFYDHGTSAKESA